MSDRDQLDQTAARIACIDSSMLALVGAVVSSSWAELAPGDRKQTLASLFEGLSSETDAAAAISPVLRVQLMELALMVARLKDADGIPLAQTLSAGAVRLLHAVCQACELWRESPELPLYRLFGPDKDSAAVLTELRGHSAGSAAHALYQAGYHIARVAHGLLCAGAGSGDPESARLFETAAVSIFTGCQLVLPEVSSLVMQTAAEVETTITDPVSYAPQPTEQPREAANEALAPNP